jgi:hypothetical protein
MAEGRAMGGSEAGREEGEWWAAGRPAVFTPCRGGRVWGYLPSVSGDMTPL